MKSYSDSQSDVLIIHHSDRLRPNSASYTLQTTGPDTRMTYASARVVGITGIALPIAFCIQRSRARETWRWDLLGYQGSGSAEMAIASQ